MDLGTNTFHLLIANGSATSYQELVHKTLPVKLGEGGINKGLIQPEAFERGLNAMKGYAQDIANHNVKQVSAIATSALRNAANGQDFIDAVKQKTGISIEIIDGDNEATYIYRGVKLAGGLGDQTSLILDIGGGSVEFILCNEEDIFWKHSFEIGAARLMDQFHRIDPIPSSSINELHSYLDNKLAIFFEAAKKHSVDNLIGSSGSFDTFAELSELQDGRVFDFNQNKNYAFSEDGLRKVTDKLIASSHQQREEMEGIVPIRVDMIVVASILARYVINKLGVKKVMLCTNSLKEGVLADLLGA